jgi:DNA-binding LacI/PurR family transcriptional regulator
MAVSIKDIARVAKVSHPTVSRALRLSPLVNPKTASRIQRIARDMGYRPSAVARSLVNRETRAFGVVVTTVTDPFIAEFVSVVEEMANDRGYSIVLANCNADPEREIKVVHSLHEQRVDGLLVMASRVGALYMPVLSKLKVPIVLVDNQHPGDFVQSVLIDNEAGTRKVTSHLIELGHARIAYIGDQFGFQSETERSSGYRQALEAASLPVRSELMVQGNGKIEGGIAAMESLLALLETPTAVVCYNDMTAIGALHVIQQHDLHVPDDISLVGFDDVSLASYLYPPLTTVRQPKIEMGRAAVEILIQLVQGSPVTAPIICAGELVVRKSSAPPRRRTRGQQGTPPR